VDLVPQVQPAGFATVGAVGAGAAGIVPVGPEVAELGGGEHVFGFQALTASWLLTALLRKTVASEVLG